jgi:hypothetical protein
MNSEQQRSSDQELVLDALFWRGRPSEPSGTCFVTNTAGVDLIKSGPSMLPAIEHVLDELVAPELAKGDTSESRFRGLPYVLCAYTLIGMREAPQRVVSFLQSRSRRLLEEVIKCVPIGFQWTNEGYNFGAPPNRTLYNFLAEVARDADDQLRSAALWASDKLDQSEARRRKHEQQEAKRNRGEGTLTDSRGHIHRPPKQRDPGQ